MTTGTTTRVQPSCGICGRHGADPVPTPFPDPVWKCRGCGARFVFPAPSEAELTARYESEHASGKWGDLFDRVPRSETARRAGEFTRIAGGPGRLLDVGFGDGRFLDAAAEQGWETWGLEVSPSAARRTDAPHRVVVGGLEALSPKARFDAITFWDVLEHVPAPGPVVQAAAGLLAPGGLMGISMPNLRGTESIVRGAGWRYYDLSVYGHLHHLGPDHVIRLLGGAGLQVATIETQGSADLRDLLNGGTGPGARLGRILLDRMSGVLARIAVPFHRGNTLMVVGRKPDATGA